jgi:hemerythrin-like domain-containing protein
MKGSADEPAAVSVDAAAIGGARRVSRRSLLGIAGVGVAAGVGGVEALRATAAGSALPEAIPPGESLMGEHGVLKRVLLIYEAAVQQAGTDPGTAAAAITGGAGIIHAFVENFHEAVEESFVFPALKSAGQLVSTVDTLLLQHARGRLITKFLLASATPASLANQVQREQITEAVNAFTRMYQPHEAREDTVVFPAYRALLTPAKLDDVGGVITTLQQKEFGPNGFAATVAHVADIERSLGIDDLTQFTPASPAPLIRT